ncbi:MAG: Hpt domain-containing protein [Candidatus Nitrohelix vancouverensis]|uniref:Hpt domain-containing protein n=1 Tax=Candidatus Nitrohelix vancouverensis TaxID=2705534 RepID=A0A7T0C091_9BACT|nr:MAG: Hpt domain-containing protein [Candidatus Nitrohelix vancouverensis]
MPSPQSEFSVEVDRVLQDLVPTFMDNRRKDIAQLETSLRQNDFDTIRDIGHKMCGSGGSYGFEAISVIGKTLETSASRNDAAAVEQAVRSLSDYVERVRISYV